MASESYVLSELKSNLKEAGLGREQLINCIDSLKGQLVKMGYNPSEVDYITQKYAAGKTANLSVQELIKLEKSLKSHLDIAQKCIKVR